MIHTLVDKNTFRSQEVYRVILPSPVTAKHKRNPAARGDRVRPPGPPVTEHEDIAVTRPDGFEQSLVPPHEGLAVIHGQISHMARDFIEFTEPPLDEIS